LQETDDKYFAETQTKYYSRIVSKSFSGAETGIKLISSMIDCVEMLKWTDKVISF